MAKTFFMLSHSTRRFLAFFYDSLSVIILFPIAIAIRFGTFDNTAFQSGMATKCIIALLSHQLAFILFGQYRGLWRYASTHDLKLVVNAVTSGILITITALLITNELEFLPRTSFIIYWLLNIMALSGGRLAYRLLKDSGKNKNGTNCLILGAGNAASQLIKSMQLDKNHDLNIVAIHDDDKTKHNRILHGINILGNINNVEDTINTYRVEIIIIAIPTANSKQVRRILSCIPSKRKLIIKILPSIGQLMNSKVDISLIKNVDPIDLLGRKSINLELSDIKKLVFSKIILITGSAGSIGSELCRQISRFTPDKVILFDISEFGLYELERKLIDEFSDVTFIPMIGNVCDKERVDEILKSFQVTVLFHAAAFKHVPLMETSAKECIKNNVFGTQNVAEAATKHNVERFILISTDKAVNPTNIMGASKRLSELICQREGEKSNNTMFTAVRFGNVLGSNGSVIPLFKEQIQNGGPITVTHKEITRFFMSIPEACQLVLQAATMGKGDDIFVLDMGEPVKITSLAEGLIRMSGLEPHKDIDIIFTGLRPGEKLHEELFNNTEELIQTPHRLVKRACACQLNPEFENNIGILRESLSSFSNFEAKKYIQKMIAEFIIKESPADHLSIENNVH